MFQINAVLLNFYTEIFFNPKFHKLFFNTDNNNF